MNPWDDIAIIIFITCDAVLENFNKFKSIYNYYHKVFENKK